MSGDTEKRPSLAEGQKVPEEIADLEAQLAEVRFPVSKRTLVDKLGTMQIHYGGSAVLLSDVICEMAIGEFNSASQFLRDLGVELARRIRG